MEEKMNFKLLRKKNHFEYYLNENIVLHKYKAIYFYIPKVACTSLKKVCADLLNVKPATPDSDINRRHYPSVKRNKIETKYKDYFKFCFVRNPWDRIVSCYNSKIKQDKDINDSFYTNGVARIFLRFGVFRAGMTFTEFVNAVKDISDKEAEVHFRSQHTFITNKNGNIIVDYVGRFERINEDFSLIFNRIGQSNIKLPHLWGHHLDIMEDRKKYREYYTEEIQEIVRKRYSKDIEMFGYEF
jgi:hypothetical protein